MLNNRERAELFNDPISTDLYYHYFDAINSKESLYICVISTGSGMTPRMYLEKSHEIDGIIRVFFRKEDIDKYMNLLATEEKMTEGAIKFWETSTKDVLPFLIKLDRNYKDKGKKGIRVVTTIFKSLKMINMDVFWTSEPIFMI